MILKSSLICFFNRALPIGDTTKSAISRPPIAFDLRIILKSLILSETLEGSIYRVPLIFKFNHANSS